MATTIVIGLPVWSADLLVDRPLEADAAAAGIPYGLFVGLEVSLGLVAMAAFVVVAVLIAWRKSQSALAMFVVVALLLRAPGFVTDLDLLIDRVPPWAGPALAVRCLDAVTALVFLFIFPTGRFVPRWTAAVAAVWAAWVFGTLATPQLNPALQLDEAWAEVVVATLALVGLAAQVVRYRSRSSPGERLQLRWVLYGLSIYVLVFAIHQLVPVAAPLVRGPGAERFWYRLVGDVAIDGAALLVPVTIGIAILRSRLLEIDLIISRTFVYLAATMILAGVFAALSSVAQSLVARLTGQSSDAVSVVIAMGVAAAFAPLKAYLQRLVHRWLGHPAR